MEAGRAETGERRPEKEDAEADLAEETGESEADIGKDMKRLGALVAAAGFDRGDGNAENLFRLGQ